MVLFFPTVVASCHLWILTCGWWIWELVAYRLFIYLEKTRIFKLDFQKTTEQMGGWSQSEQSFGTKEVWSLLPVSVCQVPPMCKSQCSNKRCSLWSEECEWRMGWHYGFQINIFQLQSKWVADYNLSNHLERKRFGAFCQIVCTKCRQCAVGQCSNKCCSLWSEECEQRMILQYNF